MAPLAAECPSGRYGSPFKEGAPENAHDGPDGVVLIDRTVHAVEVHTAGHGIEFFDVQFANFVHLQHVLCVPVAPAAVPTRCDPGHTKSDSNRPLRSETGHWRTGQVGEILVTVPF